MTTYVIRRRRDERGEDIDWPAGAGDNKVNGKKDKKAKEEKRSLKDGVYEDNWDSSENEEAEDEEMGDFTIDFDDEGLAVDGFGGAADSADEEEAASDSSNGDEDKDVMMDGSDSEASVVVHSLDNPSGSNDDEAATAHNNAFFAPVSEGIEFNNKLADETPSFQSMNLPGLSSVVSLLSGFTTPTLIQAKTIPSPFSKKTLSAVPSLIQEKPPPSSSPSSSDYYTVPKRSPSHES